MEGSSSRAPRRAPSRDLSGRLPKTILTILQTRIAVWDAYSLKGGWEGWLQVELALALGEEVDVLREAHSYADAHQRSDLSNLTANVDVIIEVKCESAHRPPEKFVASVVDDYLKLQELSQNRYAVLVVVATNDTLKGIRHILEDGYLVSGLTRTPQLVLDDDRFGCLCLAGITKTV